MILTLPLQSTDTEVDYTLIDSIKFSKSINGQDRALEIMRAFSGHYGVEYKVGQRKQSYNEFFIEVEKGIYVSVRGYKHIVVCIVGNGYANFGPNGRAQASRSKSLFEEDKNVFPFRDVLEKVREISRKKDSDRRELELKAQERNLQFLELEGEIISSLDIPCNEIKRRDYDSRYISVEFSIGQISSWNKSCITDNLNGTYDLSVNGHSMAFPGISMPMIKALVGPMIKYTFHRAEFLKDIEEN